MKIIYQYPGVHPLYSVTAFVFAILMMILISRILINHDTQRKSSQFYLFIWVLFFCLQDGVWGLYASHIFTNDRILFIVSGVFHASSAITPLVWTWFHLTTMKRNKLLAIMPFAVTLAQLVMIAINFSSKSMFYVDDHGEYCSTIERRVLFYLQFAIYIIIGVYSIIRLIRNQNESEKSNIAAAFCMNISPIFFGFFQMLYPDAPANSIGFAIACIIYYTFIEADYERQLVEFKTKEAFTSIIEEQNVQLLEQKQLLQDALDAAEQANHAKTDFLFNMSHDIRTPMNAVTGFTAMAKKHTDDPVKMQDYLDKIDSAGKQLLSLINQVLEMSRIESGKILLHEQSTSIPEQERIINSIYEEVSRSKGLDFNIFDHTVHKYIIVDVDRVNQIITNLVGNAIKYTPEGGKVSLTVNELDSDREGYGKYALIVQDNGIGMSPEFLEHIFDEFSREENSTTNHIQGTGLGMSIVKKLTDLLGGTITVQSEKGKGSVFTLTIYMRFDEAQLPSAANENDRSQMTVEGMHVLLVDDNEMNREIATEVMEDVGIIVDTACDGVEASEKVRNMYNGSGNAVYDCVLMDIQMPKMNGYEATHEIRKMEPDGKHIVIIALSANAFAEDKAKSLEAGMDYHLSKPIVINELISTLVKLTR